MFLLCIQSKNRLFLHLWIFLAYKTFFSIHQTLYKFFDMIVLLFIFLEMANIFIRYIIIIPKRIYLSYQKYIGYKNSFFIL